MPAERPRHLVRAQLRQEKSHERTSLFVARPQGPRIPPPASRGRQAQDGRVLLLFDLNGVLVHHSFDGAAHHFHTRPGVHHLVRLAEHFRPASSAPPWLLARPAGRGSLLQWPCSTAYLARGRVEYLHHCFLAGWACTRRPPTAPCAARCSGCTLRWRRRWRPPVLRRGVALASTCLSWSCAGSTAGQPARCDAAYATRILGEGAACCGGAAPHGCPTRGSTA